MDTFDTQIGSAYNVSKVIAQQNKKIKELGNIVGYSKTETDALLNTKADVDNVYTKTETDALLNEKTNLNEVYPIGSIYLTVNNTSPAELFGGQWEQIKDKFLLASGDSYIVGSTGGETSHIITQAETPRLQVPFSENAGNGGLGAFTDSGVWTSVSDVTGWINLHKFETQTPISIMPPYLVVNVWKRVY